MQTDSPNYSPLDDIEPAVLLGEHLINTILEGDSIDAIKEIIATGAPLWYQNESEGISPLHAAAYIRNTALTRFLISEGAIWNAVDNLKNTAGDIALSFNDIETYTVIRDAGIRAELLLGLLSIKETLNSSSAIVLRAADTTASGSTDAFLTSQLRYTTDEHGQDICMLTIGDGKEVGVMMGWETEIMQETVRKLSQNHPSAKNLKVLNVGFGLGIIDNLFQNLADPPSHHVIIEPHPDVLAHMKMSGWYAKNGVKILEGKWQDFVDSDELFGYGGFDIIYTDTFSEDYSNLYRFFEHLPDLLQGLDSRFSFFNGLGATNALFYDVYTHISDLHLEDLGVQVKWSDVDVAPDNKLERWGESREYFTLPIYRLPIGRMKPIV
ncbi:arginine methyl transferase [Crucibulum laeve]|uniref:Arginine methyl transferase n=1 Tax=Crucibulum laeve TaxID=68775 RepID=A0A5C3MIM6_9AGAR|nr:arginine methyl transferase [Crucibulum laeve]